MLSLDLVVLRCADIDATRAFYDCLGFTFERHEHGKGPEHYAHEDDRGVFELYPVAAGISPDTAGLGFAHPDLDALATQFTSLGLEPTPPTDNPGAAPLSSVIPTAAGSSSNSRPEDRTSAAPDRIALRTPGCLPI